MPTKQIHYSSGKLAKCSKNIIILSYCCMYTEPSRGGGFGKNSRTRSQEGAVKVLLLEKREFELISSFDSQSLIASGGGAE